MIVGLSGKMGSGKDLFAHRLSKLQPERNWIVKRFSDRLKEVASLILDVPVEMWEDQEFKRAHMGDEWSMTYRDFLQKLGTDAFRNNVHPDIWVNALVAEYHRRTERQNWIITDVRFPNEAEAIREMGFPLVRINRSGIPVDNHPSETALDNYRRWDFVVENNGSMYDLDRFVSEVAIRI